MRAHFVRLQKPAQAERLSSKKRGGCIATLQPRNSSAGKACLRTYGHAGSGPVATAMSLKYLQGAAFPSKTLALRLAVTLPKQRHMSIQMTLGVVLFHYDSA